MYYILFAIVLVILIIFIYNYFFLNSDNNRRKLAQRLIQRSRGTYDDDAERAYEILHNIRRRDAVDNYNLGTILRYNVLEGNIGNAAPQILGGILQAYTDTLAGRMRTAAPVDRDIMLFQMGDFGANMYTDDAELTLLLNQFNDAYAAVAPEIRVESVNSRVDAAVAASSNKEQAAETYLESSVRYTSSPQNVHDSKVNIDLRNILKVLKEDYGGTDFETARIEARSFIRDKSENSRKHLAMNILNNIGHNPIETLHDHEDNIFALVWDRCSAEDNADNKTLMREAVISALADCTENGLPVCINGRCGRLLNSLATLDYDMIVSGGVLTYEAYRNQIFRETQDIIAGEISAARNGNDEGLKSAADAWDDPGVTADEDSQRRLKDRIKEKIYINIKTYSDKFSLSEIDTIRSECYAAVDI